MPHRELLGSLVFNAMQDVVERDILTPLTSPLLDVFPIPHPKPGAAIGLVGLSLQIRLIDEDRAGLAPAGRYGFTLRRVSDQSVLGTVSLSWSPRWGQKEVSAAEYFVFEPNLFLLDQNDTLEGTMFALGSEGASTKLGAVVAATYYVIGPETDSIALQEIPERLAEIRDATAALAVAAGAVTPAVGGVADAVADLSPSLESMDAHLAQLAAVKDKFVHILWVSTGNFLLALKDDGTIWKAASPNADPLVWVNVTT